jgi:hypothetical protein
MAGQTRQTAIRRAIGDIRRLYTLGQRSVEEFPDRLPTGQGQKLGRATGLNRDMVEKARRFTQEYSRQDLTALCREIEKGGFPLGVQHVVRMMRVKSQRQRQRLLQKTINNRWSCRDLASAVQRLTDRRPRAGRTPVVGSTGDAVQRLLSICEQWRRLHGVIMGTKNGDEAVGLKLSSAVRNKLATGDVAVDRLYRRLLKAH